MNRVSGPSTPAPLQNLEWVLNPTAYMERAAQHHPDLFASKAFGFGRNPVFVNHPQVLQEVLGNDRKDYAAPGDLNTILTPMVGNTSIFLLNGEMHRRQRQLMMPSFHGDRMKVYGQLITDLTLKAFDRLPLHQPFLTRSVMQSISLRVILEAVFGVQQSQQDQQLFQLTAAIGDGFNSPLSSTVLFFPALQQDWGAWSPWGKFLRQRQQLDDLLYAEIDRRRSQPMGDRTDILSLLMTAEDEDGNGMSNQELRDELVSLMIAGHETTATAMTWALYWLHQLPDVRTRLLEELDALGDDDLDPMTLARSPYLTAVCQETLRIYPVAMLTFPRVAQRDLKLSGYDIEAGTVVMGCIYLLHHREELYPNPKQFQPERFLERKFSNYEFMPFGSGARRCIGEALALFEMKLVLATILRNYALELAQTQPVRPGRRGVTLAPMGGVKMMLTGRRE